MVLAHRPSSSGHHSHGSPSGSEHQVASDFHSGAGGDMSSTILGDEMRRQAVDWAEPKSTAQKQYEYTFAKSALTKRFPVKKAQQAPPWTLRDFQPTLPLDENSHVRTAWLWVLTIILIYTGTLMPFRMCFLELRIPEEWPSNQDWLRVEFPVDVLFWGDLVLNFFMTFRRDDDGCEEKSLYRISLNQLTGEFWLNFFACLPASAYSFFIQLAAPDMTPGGSGHRAIRLLRMQKLTRMARILRGGSRMAKVVRYAMMHHWLSKIIFSRNWRTMKLFTTIFLLAHLFACAWYLIAAMNDDYDSTWVAARDLLDETPFMQWLSSMYFIVTVFTTVGFGDISGHSAGEMIFLCFGMFAGTMVNSIIVGDVIDMLTRASQEEVQREQKKMLMDIVIEGTELYGTELAADLMYWAHASDPSNFNEKPHYETLKHLMSSGLVPGQLTNLMPTAMFDGLIGRNVFVTRIVDVVGRVPNRLSIFLALGGQKQSYDVGQAVYNEHEHAFNVYFVLSGTFAELTWPKHESAYKRRGTRGGDGDVDIGALTTLKQFSDDNDAFQTSADYKHRMEKAGTMDYEPYRLWGVCNYFGEVEVLCPALRSCTVRCERAGSLLVLRKDDFTELVHEFSEFQSIWKAAAKRRRRGRIILKNRCAARTTRLDYVELAVVTLQKWVRSAWPTILEASKTGSRRETRGKHELHNLHHLHAVGGSSSAAAAGTSDVLDESHHAAHARAAQVPATHEHILTLADSVRRIENSLVHLHTCMQSVPADGACIQSVPADGRPAPLRGASQTSFFSLPPVQPSAMEDSYMSDGNGDGQYKDSDGIAVTL